MKVLIAEDDRLSRKLLQKTLGEWGYDVIAVENGQKALEIFLEGEVKLIIADWMMPEMDGISLCREIRTEADSGYAYVILLTGKDRKEDIVQGLDAGADDYLTKPFDIDELKVRIRTGERVLQLEKELVEKNASLVSLNTKLEELASTDPLMQIGNRRSFYTNIERIHDRSRRYNELYGITICDIDYFKKYNDTYGHLAGDQILKSVAEVIKNAVRISDEVYRFGGEEIVIIMPNQDNDGMLMAAERIRKALEERQLEHKATKEGFFDHRRNQSADQCRRRPHSEKVVLVERDPKSACGHRPGHACGNGHQRRHPP